MGTTTATDSKKLIVIRNKVIRWYDIHGRNFPWRMTRDPYRVLIAEVLLRRTTATAVSRIYDAFLDQFDKPESLIRAKETTIAAALGSLGLQSLRAHQLKRMAMMLVEEYSGKVPCSHAELVAMPGVGSYIASAVRNFACGVSVPLVDGNVSHLVSRLFGYENKGPSDSSLWEFMTKFGGRRQDARFYWGIIDIVAKICLRKCPRCLKCPLSRVCASYRETC